MKKYLSLLLPLLLLCLSACSQTVAEETQPARAVYYLSETDTGRELDYEIVHLPEGAAEQQIRDIIAAMRTPVNANHRSLLPEAVELEKVEVFGSTVVIRFSEAYDEMSEIDRSMLVAAINLSLAEVGDIRYARVTGMRSSIAGFMNEESVVLEDSDLRLTSFEIEVYPVDHSVQKLVPYALHISSEQEVLTPYMVLEEMMAGQLGEAAPFDGRMDVRNVVQQGENGLKADLYVPVEMDLRGREADVWSVVNSLCSCRGIEYVTVIINGNVPSERGLEGCDGILFYDPSWIR